MTIKDITNRLYEIRCILEDEEEQELKNYKKVYRYIEERASEKSAQNNTEGCEEFNKLIEQGLSDEASYLSTYDPDVYEAYNNLGEHFKEYCEFRAVKEEIDYFEGIE